MLAYLIGGAVFFVIIIFFALNWKGLERELKYGRALLSPEEKEEIKNKKEQEGLKLVKYTNTACLILSYCLYEDGTRLSVMAEESTELGIAAVCNKEASHIIFSTAYDCWRKEAEIKKYRAFKVGITSDKIKVIEGVRHTFDEVKLLKSILNSTGAEKLIVVVEKDHFPRVQRMLEKKFPEIQFDFRIFKATKYERTLEPSWIKAHRGSHFMWWLWNFLCNLVW